MTTAIPGPVPGWEHCAQLVLIYDGVWVKQDFPPEMADDAPALRFFAQTFVPRLWAKIKDMKYVEEQINEIGTDGQYP